MFMKILSILTLSLVCLFLSSASSVNAIGQDGNSSRTSCQDDAMEDHCSVGDPRCSYERRDRRTGTIMHFDVYGNLIGRTKG
jgi:hypothetical protein